MAIVISGVNNNDKITASDGTIDLLSGVNFNSEITVPSFKVGSNIQIGNAGIITATTFTGNVTGNINNDILLLQTGSYERVRIDSSGRVLIGTTTEGHENADDLTIATSGTGGITIRSGTSNSGAIYFSDATSGTAEYAGFLAYSHANNSMVFGTNTAEKLRIMSNGYIGLGINSPSRRVHIHTTGSGSDYIQFTNDTTGTTTGDGYVFGINGDEDVIHNNLEATNMRFYTSGAERLSITSGGDLLIGRTSSGAHSSANELQIGSGSASSGLTIFSATTNSGSIYYADGTSGDARYRGFLEYYHASDSLAIGIAGDEKFRFALNGTNGDLRFDIGTGGQAQIAALSGNGNAYNLGSSGGAAIRFIDTSGSHTIEFDTHWSGYHHSTALKIGKTGSLITRDHRDASIGREYTSGTLTDGQSVSYNGSGTTLTNGRLNLNSVGGNAGGWIGCLSVASQDGNPSGAAMIMGVHGQGFNVYNRLLSNFDSGITVTWASGNWSYQISNSSGETIYYVFNVIHMGTANTTYYGR